MSTAIVLPTLTEWTEQHITSIFQAKTNADLTSALDGFLSDKAVITFNGKQISRADYVGQLQAEKFREVSADVNFLGAVQAPTDPDQPFDAGSVGVFYNATIFENIKIRDVSVSRQVTASVNVVIAQDPDVPKPPPSPFRGFFDGRRVMALNQVSTQGPATSSNTA
ncbi:hypothetical protein JR316_0011056 [Psilocybe cubensis]|uniref:Uncharacterized protein n=2 Tax=Psilocybe cubensis TaxID=181762 RepID=A0ACB8GQ60_PSICU|nr:hypothetical protein JR316_0011056 [Psilocybe cubensis]KAH9477140.1 hypothetical protein JR316_0011056 [Psilocybe cubensis]